MGSGGDGQKQKSGPEAAILLTSWWWIQLRANLYQRIFKQVSVGFRLFSTFKEGARAI